jgi:hypothetical protein
MARSKAEKLAAIHAEALAEYNRTYSALQPERMQCRDDRRFVAIPGAQWEGLWGEQFENRPRLEVNKTLLAVNRVYTEWRNNRITVDFVSRDGTEADQLADTCDGLFRADWDDSCGEEAGDNAFDEATAGGFGAFRLRASLENEYDDDAEMQRIRFEPIYDADTSVFWDLDAKRYDKSDAKHCWVIYSMTRQAYEAKYDDNPSTWPKMSTASVFDWATPSVVYVAEYYRVEDERTAMVRITTPDGKDHDVEADDYAEALAGTEGLEYDRIRLNVAMGGEVTKQWRKRNRCIRKLIMSGNGILEDCGHIAGKHIPIIPVFGKRWFIDNVERCMGVVRPAKDSQRLKNMQLSKLAEIASLSAVEKPILAPEQVAGLETYWARDNIENYPYLLAQPLTAADGSIVATGPMSYTKPPQVPPAMAALLQLTETDMAELLGYNQQAEKMVSNISGKAVEMIQNRLDMNAYIYLSNMAKSMRRAGEVWLSMAQEVYVEEGRAMKAIGDMSDVSSVVLMQPKINEKTGDIVYANDLSRAKFDVSVDIGPTSQSRRDSMLRSITGMMQMTTDPADLKVLTSLALMNIEGEGLGDVRNFYRKQLVQIGVMQPTDGERAEMEAAMQAQQQQQDPQALYLMAEAEKAQAQALQAQANTIKAQADAKKSEAQAIATLAGIEDDQARTAIEAAKAIGAGLR